MTPRERSDVPPFSPRLYRAFARWLRSYFARNFNAVRVARDGAPRVPEDGPVVVYANHPSWWDPILFVLLQREFLDGRPGYGPIDAAMLERYGFFGRLGMFGVEPGTRRGAATFLRTGRAILERPESVLWITAEGEFRDPRRRPVRLAPGLAHLLAGPARATVLPLAIEYPFWTERKPEVTVRFGDPIVADGSTGRDADAWRETLEAALTDTLDRLALDVAERDPSRFDSLVRGGSGVGGVYDLWRRVRARVRGERFDAAHMDRG